MCFYYLIQKEYVISNLSLTNVKSQNIAQKTLTLVSSLLSLDYHVLFQSLFPLSTFLCDNPFWDGILMLSGDVVLANYQASVLL